MKRTKMYMCGHLVETGLTSEVSADVFNCFGNPVIIMWVLIVHCFFFYRKNPENIIPEKSESCAVYQQKDKNRQSAYFSQI